LRVLEDEEDAVDNEELEMVGKDGIVGVGVVEGDGRLTGRGGAAAVDVAVTGERESRSIRGVGVVDVGV